MADEQKQAQEAPAQTGEANLLDDIVQATKLKPEDESFGLTKTGIQSFIEMMLEPGREQAKITVSAVDDLIAQIDAQVSRQVDEVLHDEQFQELESAWRGLKFLVDRTDFRENIKINLLNASKQDFIDDFEDSPEIPQSGLYKTVYTAEYGQFGGQPYGAMIGNYDFGPGSQDMSLLGNIASVAAMAHAPFISAAGPEFFGVENFAELANLKDLSTIFEGPQYTKWRGLRESEDARYIGLTLPRFLGRLPYGPETVPAKSFNYVEDVTGGEDDFLWCNTAFALASRMSDSFAKYRMTSNIIGPQGGGTVDDLHIYNYEAMGSIQTKIPTQVLISERREFELAEQGFIALTMRKGSDNAAFFSANSIQKPKFFGNTKEGKEAETNYKLGAQLPYMMITNRLAHYIKVLQRENIGSWKQRGELESELNTWIRQYVSDQDNPTASVRSRRPLRKAEIAVSDVEGDPGWYSVSMKVMPHLKYMGANFTLSLVGKLDKE
jgi:type VI secretion system protein ImpC